jgi:AcrR family transcriptional regulator
MQDGQKKEIARAKRRRLSPEARRVELLEAAMAVLNTLGPSNARVEDITRAAGAAKGTFYLYFPSWEDMLAAVREHILSEYVTEMRKRFVYRTPADWWQAFENECVEFMLFHEKLGGLHEAVFHGAIAERPIDPALSAVTVLGWMLETGIEIGACRSVDVEVAARLLFSAMHAMGDSIAQTGERGRYLNATLDLLRSWLCVPGSDEAKKHTSFKNGDEGNG